MFRNQFKAKFPKVVWVLSHCDRTPLSISCVSATSERVIRTSESSSADIAIFDRIVVSLLWSASRL